MSYNQNDEFTWPQLLAGCAAIIIVLGLLGSVVGVGFLGIVDAGEACVSVTFGDVDDDSIAPGLHLKMPWTQFKCFNTRNTIYITSEHKEENADYRDGRVSDKTADGQPMQLSYTVVYRVNATQIGEIYRNVAQDMNKLNEVGPKTLSRSIVRRHMGLYSAEQFQGTTSSEDGTTVSSRSQIESEITMELESGLKELGIILVDFRIREPDFTDEYDNAILAQQIAQENIETQQFNAQAARQEAEAEKARTDAKVYEITEINNALASSPDYLTYLFIREVGANVQWGIMPFDGVQSLLPLGENGQPATFGEPSQ